MMLSNAMYSSGRLVKIGVYVATAATVTKAGKKQIKLNKQKKALIEKKLCKSEMGITMGAVEALNRFCKTGNSANSTETSKNAELILTFILPILALQR